MSASVYWSLSVLCVSVCLCEGVAYQIRVTLKKHYVSDLGKLDALLHKKHLKVLLALRY